jgi:hypothetical protein
MPWEPRRNGREYYYKSVRLEGKPRRIYLGAGPSGRAHEILDRRQRHQRHAELAEQKLLAAEIDEDSRSWLKLRSWIRTLTATYLLLNGYYCHHGEWRPRMGRPRTRQDNPRRASPEDAADLQARLDFLNARANAGEPGAIRELDAFIDEHPEIWESVGDLSAAARLNWILRLTNSDAVMRVAATRNLECWMDELTGPRATPIERAIAESAASAKLALIHAETQAAGGSTSPAIATLNARRLDMAQNRLNAILKNLAQVQSLSSYRESPAAPKPPSAPMNRPVAQAG